MFRDFLHQPQATTKPTRTWAGKGYRRILLTSLNRSHLALSHLTFKYLGKFQADNMDGQISGLSEIFLSLSLCLSYLKAFLQFECWTGNISLESERFISVNFWPTQVSNSDFFFGKWEGGAVKQQRQPTLMRCFAEKLRCVQSLMASVFP